METALGRQASALLATLNIECVNADNLNEAATEAFRQHPDHRIVTSFPGLGGHRARVLAEIGDDRGRFADARGLKAFAGSAPVTSVRAQHLRYPPSREEQSTCRSRLRLGLRRHPATCPIKDHYDRRRTHGDRHAGALRNVFNRLLGQLYHCLQANQTYDESKAFPGSVHGAEPAVT